jgi:hypothetical protein
VLSSDLSSTGVLSSGLPSLGILLSGVLSSGVVIWCCHLVLSSSVVHVNRVNNFSLLWSIFDGNVF